MLRAAIERRATRYNGKLDADQPTYYLPAHGAIYFGLHRVQTWY